MELFREYCVTSVCLSVSLSALEPPFHPSNSIVRIVHHTLPPTTSVAYRRTTITWSSLASPTFPPFHLSFPQARCTCTVKDKPLNVSHFF